MARAGVSVVAGEHVVMRAKRAFSYGNRRVDRHSLYKGLVCVAPEDVVRLTLEGLARMPGKLSLRVVDRNP